MHILPVGALLRTTTILETCSPTLTSFKFLKFNLGFFASNTINRGRAYPVAFMHPTIVICDLLPVDFF